MLRFLKSFFGKKTEVAAQAPYKVETPTVTPIIIPPVAEPVKPVAEPVPAVKKPAARKAPAKKKPAADKSVTKTAAKPAAITAGKKRNNKKTHG